MKDNNLQNSMIITGADNNQNGGFKWHTPVLLADETTMPIGEIVDKKLQVEVLSYDLSEKRVVKRKVTGWSNNGFRGEIQWTSVTGKEIGGRHIGAKGGLKKHVARNHVYISSNSVIPAERLNTANVICRGLNPTQRQVFLGGLLGDGCFSVDKRSSSGSIRFVWNHSIKQYDWAEAKAKCFGNLTMRLKNGLSGFGSVLIRRCTTPLICYKDFYDHNYVNGKKVVNEQWLNQLGPLGLAVWYMDDGSLIAGQDSGANVTNKYSRLKLSTHGFSKEENYLICQWFWRRCYSCGVYDDNRGKGSFIDFTTNGAYHFFKLIAPYIIKSLSYKLPYEFRDLAGSIEWWNDNEAAYELKEVKVNVQKGKESVKWETSKSEAYDIEVDGCHCYFANGFLVHDLTRA